MDRQKFVTRTITLTGETQRDTLIQLARNLPLDKVNPLEIVVREKQKVRKLDQNALMFAGPLKDIADQAWYNNRQYSVDTWHLTYKRLFLPEVYDEDLCKDGYLKWDYDPTGMRVLVGSTTQLTVRGFAIYLEQIYADGANMGVQFSAPPSAQHGVKTQ